MDAVVQSAPSRCSPVPPVHRRIVDNDAGGDLDVAQVAELPQLFGCAGVLEGHLVDIERAELCGSVPVDRVGQTFDQSAELFFVVGGDLLPCRPTLRLGGHGPRLARTRPTRRRSLGTVWRVFPKIGEFRAERNMAVSENQRALYLWPLVLHICNTNLDWVDMDLAERISTLRRVNGLSARQVAALVDVAPTTVTRIESGVVSPSFDLAQEILTVLGEPIGFTGAADVDAIATARLALDPELGVSSTPGVESWRQRWARIGLLDGDGRVVPAKEADLLFRAGRSARLSRRPGAVDFAAGLSADQIAESCRAAGIEYALTGGAGANRYRSSAGEAWTVLYVENVSRAADAAGLVRKDPGSFGTQATLIPFDGVSEVGRVIIDGVKVVSRHQVVIDAYGGIDRMVEQADILMGKRVV